MRTSPLPRLVVLAALVASAPVATQQKPPDTPQPKFETRADLVLVDVSVIDRDGQPIPDLKAEDFELEVNGQPRTINTVQFISTQSVQTSTVSAERAPEYTTNEAPSSGRLLLFVIDENYLRFGANRAVLRTAERVLDTLAPGDLVGLVRLPFGDGGVPLTSDRSRVRRALERVTGRQPARRFDRVRLNEAEAFENNDTFLKEQVIRRECGGDRGFALEACVKALEADSKAVINDASARTATSIRAMELLLQRLELYTSPINLIYISEGLFIGRDRNDLAQIARLAASARVSFHVVQPDQSMFDNDQPQVVGGFGEATRLAEGLEQIAGQTRGSYYKVTTGGAGAFQRISRELSAYYLLSFEPTDADRHARDRRIRVQVKRRGLTIRYRSTYAIRDTAVAEAPLPPEKQLEELLAAPLPTNGLPIRVATYSVTNPQDARVRVIVSAEIGDASTEPAEWPIGLLVVDKDDTVLVSTAAPMKLEPATPRAASPRLLLTTFLVNPGEYHLRLATIGPEGRTGSVHHTVDARLASVSGDALKASNLMIMSAPASPDDPPRPTPSSVVDTETLTASLELSGSDGQRLNGTRVAFQIAESNDGPALVTADARSLPRGNAQRAFAASLKLTVLPPGAYVARAVVSVPGEDEVRFVRAFRFALAAAPTATTGVSRAVDPDEAPAPRPPSQISVALPAFAVGDVLKPQVVRRFIDSLEQRHPVSRETAAVLEAARRGQFAAPPADVRTQDGDEPALSFVRGLAALEKKQYAQAAAWFQLTLRGASDFLGAAFFLGAVHAASGRDTDAVGAWQMSLVDGGEAAYPMLVDALLRIGDGNAALDLIAEAPNAWPSADARWRRVASAQAMLGQYQQAMETLQPLLQKSTNDPDLLFLAIQILYRQHLAAPLPSAARDQFADYAKRYEQANGPQQALVNSWRRSLMR